MCLLVSEFAVRSFTVTKSGSSVLNKMGTGNAHLSAEKKDERNITDCTVMLTGCTEAQKC